MLELARARLPEYRDHFFPGNGFYWVPPRRFDYVRTELVYVPAEYEKQYIEHIIRNYLTPKGRLLVANYAEDYPEVEAGIQHGIQPTKRILEHLAELGFEATDYKDGHDPVKNRKVRIAVLAREA